MVTKSGLPHSCEPEVIWIGGELKDVEHQHQVSQLVNLRFYKKCIIGALTLKIGDFVLVSNADSAEPDSIEGCDIGRILRLYEQDAMLESSADPYRAHVQWYSWPRNIPNKAFDNDDICIDFDLEVIEEHRPYDADISLETVFGKCLVLHSDIENTANDILKSFRAQQKTASNCPMFVCRFKFIKDTKRSYRLVPLEFCTAQDNVEEEHTSKKLRPRRKSCVAGLESATVTRSGGGSSSSSARKSKRNQIGKRRASVATMNAAVEFIDIDSVAKENKVSPIKIIGGRSIVRVTAAGDNTKKQQSQQHKKKEINENYLTASPLAEQNIRVSTPNSRATAARRNLNLSLGDDGDAENTSNESDCLNYSIVNETSRGEQQKTPKNDMKIKLRLSERKNHLPSLDEDPLSFPVADAENALVQRQRKRLGLNENSTPNASDIYQTPTKRTKETELTAQAITPSNRRKSILKSASRIRDESTPRRSIQLSNIVEKRIFQEDEIISTPKRSRQEKINNNDLDHNEEYTPKKSTQTKTPTRKKRCSSPKQQASLTPSAKLKLIRSGEIVPSIEARQHDHAQQQQQISTKAHKNAKSALQLARESLHVSVVPQSLPCREKEFDNIYTFLEGKIQDQCGGCMYVSGVPGTGKTATVTGVIRTLQTEARAERLPAFEFLEINGMRLTEPRQAYVQIYKQLTGKTVTWEHAHALLEKRFTTPAPRRLTTVLLVDELDILCNRRQDVVYNLLDWPTKSAARLVVITIANTMDLPERLLMGKVTSRLGLTRLTFQPYTHKQLQEIVTARLSGSEAFKGDAVQLVARKVAAVSGDARRALDICRRSTEIADASAGNAEGHKIVSMQHVQQALSEMIASAKVQAIKNCSRLEQIFLQAVAAEVTRTGVEETTFMGVYTQMESIAAFLGAVLPVPGRALRICSKLGAERLLICEHSRNDIFQKILLNVSMDDIHYALRVNHNHN